MPDLLPDRERLDLLRASVANARQAVAQTADLVEETEELLRWLRRFESPLLNLQPPESE